MFHFSCSSYYEVACCECPFRSFRTPTFPLRTIISHLAYSLCIDFLFPQISHLSCDQRLVDYMWLITRHRLFQSLKVRLEFSKTKFFERLRRRIRWKQNPWCFLFLLHVYALIRCNILRYFTNPIFFRIIHGSTSPKPYRNYYSYFLKKLMSFRSLNFLCRFERVPRAFQL